MRFLNLDTATATHDNHSKVTAAMFLLFLQVFALIDNDLTYSEM